MQDTKVSDILSIFGFPGFFHLLQWMWHNFTGALVCLFMHGLVNKVTLPDHPSMLTPAAATAAATKSLQSCLTLCDPTDGSPPGSSVPGILQARTLEWVAISFSNA